MKTPAATTTTTSSVCPKCGTIAKSGKASCCGRGGSWFQNCGGVANTILRHTWYEGIQACKKAWSQSRIAVGQRDKGFITAAKPFIFSSAIMSTSMAGTTPVIMTSSMSSSMSTAHGIVTTNSKVIAGVGVTIMSMSDNMSIPAPIIASVGTSVATQGCENLMNIVFHISLMVTIVLQC